MFPLVTATTDRFAYSGSDCLYRDQFGRRVIADIEGCGFASLDSPGQSLLGLFDDQEAFGFQWTFQDYLVVVAPEGLDVGVNVSTSIAGGELNSTSESGRIDGCGWVIKSDSPMFIDDMRVERPAPVDGFPVPFFTSAEIGRGLAHLSGPPAQLVDAFEIDDLHNREFRVQNMSKLVELDSTFGDGTPHVAQCASHLNRATWRVILPHVPVQGLLLRKTFDQFHGRQRARVLINGVMAGWWYVPRQDRRHRWAVFQFGIPARFLSEDIEITIDPPPGTPLWSVSRMEVLALG